jgi:hypothetical protein
VRCLSHTPIPTPYYDYRLLIHVANAGIAKTKKKNPPHMRPR